MSIDIIGTEQTSHLDTLCPVDQNITGAGVQLSLYRMPENPDRSTRTPDMLAIGNPDGFSRVLQDGMSALEDGEAVYFASARERDLDGVHSNAVYELVRNGDNFTMTAVSDHGEHHRTESISRSGNIVIDGAEKKITGLFGQEAFMRVGHRGLSLSDKAGKLGDTVRALGFTSEEHNSEMPMPDKLVSNIDSLQEAGVQVPNIKFFTDGEIGGQEYLEAWASGRFPASELPSYFAHDLLAEHYQPLIVFREDVMTIASLYAQAALQADEIIGSVPASEYEINKEIPELKDVLMSGQQKIDHAAFCLDNLTGELAEPIHDLDLPANSNKLKRSFTDHPPHGWRHMPQMIRTILDSPQRETLIDHLEQMDSHALDPETGEFSYQTFMREIFTRAQEFWGITPNESEPKPATEHYDNLY